MTTAFNENKIPASTSLPSPCGLDTDSNTGIINCNNNSNIDDSDDEMDAKQSQNVPNKATLPSSADNNMYLHPTKSDTCIFNVNDDSVGLQQNNRRRKSMVSLLGLQDSVANALA